MRGMGGGRFSGIHWKEEGRKKNKIVFSAGHLYKVEEETMKTTHAYLYPSETDLFVETRQA